MKKFTDMTLEDYLKELSGDAPVPGGGSASAYVGSLAMGLTQMVASISLKRKKKAGLSPEEEKKDDEQRATIKKIRASLEKAKRDAFQIVNLDPQVYEEVMAVWGDAEKMEDALQNSFRLQADLAFILVMAREWNNALASLVTGSIKNDLLVSAAMGEAAYKGAYHTAMINAHYMKDEGRKAHAEKALQELKVRFEKGDSCVGEPSQTA
ncbi:MAG: cyclodeaminase/cyclohydrolase family protein [Candidatus Omnitrophota bacterium]|nr:cyclodeaminase/cyclohydrolase family protein [Candidatus Omnitrophota bacterium]